ncbi:MAG: hypothetical protein D6732_02625 [Methanobacteriota archaeon]|nr:MAG: hypothetical protein D6732_02625 [Euryarchaeota archaeon]
MTEQIKFTPPKENVKPKIPGLPVPKIKTEDLFSISYNHKDHTLIINFNRSGEIQSSQTMNRIDRSIESLSAKLAQQAINLAQEVGSKDIEIIIVSSSEDLGEIIKTLGGLLFRNVPTNINLEIVRSRTGSKINIGSLAISHYLEPIQVLANVLQRDQVFVVIDGRKGVKWEFNFKPPQSFLIVESLASLTDNSVPELSRIIDEIKPTSFFQANSNIELINSLSNVLTFVSMSLDV